MQAATKPNHAAGISIMALLVAAMTSLAYYQFVYVPEASRKPVLRPEVLNPAESVQVKIAEGASLPSSSRTFVPAEARTTIGVSNKVVWTNTDTIPHSVTGEGYVDAISGKFDSIEQQGKLIRPGETFEFVFTKTGEYLYHCEPHPQMRGKVTVMENFS